MERLRHVRRRVINHHRLFAPDITRSVPGAFYAYPIQHRRQILATIEADVHIRSGRSRARNHTTGFRKLRRDFRGDLRGILPPRLREWETRERVVAKVGIRRLAKARSDILKRQFCYARDFFNECLEIRVHSSPNAIDSVEPNGHTHNVRVNSMGYEMYVIGPWREIGGPTLLLFEVRNELLRREHTRIAIRLVRRSTDVR